MSEQRRRLGERLATFRKAARLTQSQLARAVFYERTSITHVEAGRQPAPREFWEQTDRVLGVDGALLAAFEELDRARGDHVRGERERAHAVHVANSDRWRGASSGQVWVPGVDDALAAVAGSWRQSVGTVAKVAPAAPVALHWLVDAAPDEQVARMEGWRRIGDADVRRVRAARAHLKDMDNALGGGAALPMAHTYLQQQVAPLLEGRFDDATGRELLAAVAELTLEVGWMAYDAGQQPQARRHMLHALRLAHAADDRLFGGRVTTAMSHQALHLGRVSEAIDLARSARGGIKDVATPKAMAMVAAMEACAFAAAGDQSRCHVALREGERALERERPAGDQPAWLDFDGGGLAGHAARALRDLGEAREAERFAIHSISQCLPDHSRTRAQRKTIRATALIQGGELDEAAAVGEDIIDEAWGLHSSHVQGEVSHLAGLMRQERSSAVSQFLGRADELSQTQRGVTG